MLSNLIFDHSESPCAVPGLPLLLLSFSISLTTALFWDAGIRVLLAFFNLKPVQSYNFGAISMRKQGVNHYIYSQIYADNNVCEGHSES